MAVSYVGVTSGSSAAVTSTSFVTTLPAGWAAGDVAILVGHISATSLTMTTPAGWLAVPGITNPTNEGTNSRVYAWYRVLQAGDTAPAITVSGAATGGWDMAVYRGADQASPIGQVAAAGTAAVTSRALPSLTGVAAGSGLHAFAHARVATGTIPTGLNWAAAYTESADVATSRATSAANVRLANARQLVSAAGSYGGETVTVANTISSSMIVGLVEIKAAGPAPPTVTLTPAAFTLTAATVTATPGGAVSAPVPVATYFLPTQVGDSALATSTFTPSEGEIIVVKLLAESNGSASGGPSGGGLTFTRQQLINASGQALAALWTATVGSNPSAMTVTVAEMSTNANWSALVERWPAGTTLGAVAVSAGATGSGAPLASLTTTAPKSAISWAVGDWNALAPGTPVYRGSAVQEAIHDRSPSSYVAYYAYQAEPAAGSHDFGLTSPAGQKWSAVGVEIKAAPSGGGPATVTLTAATLTLSAAPVIPAPLPVTVTLTPAAFALTAAPVTAVPRPVAVTLTPAGLAMAAVPVVPVPLPVAVTLTSASLTLSAVPVAATPKPVAVTLTPAQLTLTAVPVTPVSGPARGSVTLTAAVLTFTAVAVTPTPRAINRTLTPALFTLTAVPVAATPLPVTVTLTPAAVVLAAMPVVPVPQPVTVALTAALLRLEAVPVDAHPSPVRVAPHGVVVRRPESTVAVPTSSGRVTWSDSPATVRRTR